MKIASLTVAAFVLFIPVAADAAETITYKYDARGRLVEVKRTGPVNNNVTTSYSHDKANNRKQVNVAGSPNSPP